MKNSVRLGRYFLTTAIVAFGILQLVQADFVRLIPKLPTWIPWHPFWARLVGVAFVAIGLAIATGKKARQAAALLAILLFLVAVLLYPPQIAKNPMAGFMWTNPCKTLALFGGAVLLSGIPRKEEKPGSSVVDSPKEKLSFFAAIFLGVFLLVCGVQHFVYVDFVMTMVPQWLPGLRFWAYFTGTALIAGGIGILYPKTAKWAAALSDVMIFLWVPLVHLPRALANLHNAGEMAGVFEALALSGVAFLILGTQPHNKVG